MRRTPAANSPEFDASLVALVATSRTEPAPDSPIDRAYSASIANVRSRASGASRPVASTP